ncbi:hypothetical protein EJ110_NYTH18073 [Nymphaea thermarum]|nr:hypothetical protein EJ110_NYTH18073 [Nymphaea thermarum]
MHLVKWDRMCMPVEEGGVGIRRLEEVLLTRADGRGYGLQGNELITSVREFTSASQGSSSLDIAARLGVFKDDIRFRDANDSLVWSDDGKDNFRAADIMSKCRTQGVKEWWRKKIWYSSAPAHLHNL